MKFLTDNTRKVFFELSRQRVISEFTFVGGSALGSYLHHRLSEDLDFFSWKESLPDTTALIRELSTSFNVEIGNLSPQQIDLLVDTSKVTLAAYNWELLKNKRHPLSENIYVADPEILCAMKINTLSMRAKFRDYYDLYVINKEQYSIEQIFDFAKEYLPGMTKKILGMQLTYTDDIEDESIDHLEPKYKVSLSDIQQHFAKEIEALI